jgi:subtilase family serine protease
MSTVTVSSLTAPVAPGTYTFRAFVDGMDVTVEKSEGNNQKTETYTFASSGPEKPDFDIVSVVFAPDPPAQGADGFTATVTAATRATRRATRAR